MPVAVLLFARLPVPGRVKTRLARTTSPALAADLYRQCLLQVTHALEQAEAERTVWVAEAADVERMATLVGPAWRVRAQRSGGLTARLNHAFNEAFEAGADRVIVTATDTPGLSAEDVHQAVATLDTHDAVLGPATDGGYYLLGLRRWPVPVFRDISWSTSAVADQTRARLRAHGCTWGELAPRPDVDTEQDLRTWLRDHPDHALTRWVLQDGRLG